MICWILDHIVFKILLYWINLCPKCVILPGNERQKSRECVGHKDTGSKSPTKCNVSAESREASCL